MKLDSRLLIGLGSLLGSTVLRAWMGTLDIKGAFYDPADDPASPECVGGRVYIFWHEYLLACIYLRGHCNITVLTSRHRDAEILARLGRFLGYGVVRGSTQRGGVTALRQLLQTGGRLHLATPPDGPRGPRRLMTQGSVYLASRLGVPLVALGLGYDRPWRIRSAWDHFALPRPYSRVRIVGSPGIHVPPDLDRDGLEHFRQRIERVLNRMTAEAEAWAESRTSRPGQFVMRPMLHRMDSPHHVAAAVARAHKAATGGRASDIPTP